MHLGTYCQSFSVDKFFKLILAQIRKPLLSFAHTCCNSSSFLRCMRS